MLSNSDCSLRPLPSGLSHSISGRLLVSVEAFDASTDMGEASADLRLLWRRGEDPPRRVSKRLPSMEADGMALVVRPVALRKRNSENESDFHTPVAFPFP